MLYARYISIKDKEEGKGGGGREREKERRRDKTIILSCNAITLLEN